MRFDNFSKQKSVVFYSILLFKNCKILEILKMLLKIRNWTLRSLNSYQRLPFSPVLKLEFFVLKRTFLHIFSISPVSLPSVDANSDSHFRQQCVKNRITTRPHCYTWMNKCPNIRRGREWKTDYINPNSIPYFISNIPRGIMYKGNQMDYIDTPDFLLQLCGED